MLAADPEEAGRRAAGEARASLGDQSPSFAVLFASAHFLGRAENLVAAVARELQRVHGLRTSVMFTKSYFGTPAEESLVQRILHNCDFAVAGIGD